MDKTTSILTLGPHGTKILGSITAVLGVLSTADPTVLGSIFGVNGTTVATVVAGLLTILRGFGNSAATPPSA